MSEDMDRMMEMNNALKAKSDEIASLKLQIDEERSRCAVLAQDIFKAVTDAYSLPGYLFTFIEKKVIEIRQPLKRKDEAQVCDGCGWNNGPNHGGGSRVMYTVGKVTKCGSCLPTTR